MLPNEAETVLGCCSGLLLRLMLLLQLMLLMLLLLLMLLMLRWLLHVRWHCLHTLALSHLPADCFF